MRLRTLTFLINKGFRTIQRSDQYIAYGTIRGNMQQIHIRGEEDERGLLKTAENPFKSVVITTNLNNIGLLKKDVTVEKIF